jgi:hypothetical protein
MAGQVLKRRRLVNPGRRRRMSPKQIKYFGTARQKAALKASNPRYRGGRGPHKGGFTSRKVRRAYKTGSMAKARYYRERSKVRGARRNQGGLISSAERAAERAVERVERAAETAMGTVTRSLNRGRRNGRRASPRRRNVGEILTVIPANPGRRRKKMAATRRRNRRRARVSNQGYHRRRNRRMNFGHRRRRHNRRHNPKVVVRYRNRAGRHHHRRRNQGRMLTGNMGAVVGILGGAAVTKIITNLLPANLSTGPIGYLTTGVVAWLTGNMTGRILKNRSLGNWMTVGGLLIVGLQLVGQFMPSLQLPFGLSSQGTSGMGLITSSNFYVPQVNLPGSMASFVTPAGVPVPVVVPATAMKGLGAMNQGLRRVGRLR